MGEPNILEREPQTAEKEEEIVVNVSPKGKCDAFFSLQYSHLPKASSRNAAQSQRGRSGGVRITQFRDSDLGWMRDHQTLQWVSQNRAGSGRAAATTVA